LTRAQIPPPPQVHWNQTDEGQPLCDAECFSFSRMPAHPSPRCYPSRRASAEFALRTKLSTTLWTVANSTQTNRDREYEHVIHPVFVDTTNAPYNSTFNRGYAVHDCPLDTCYDAETGVRFWGFVHLSVSSATGRR
jgi:hypothetical protein